MRTAFRTLGLILFIYLCVMAVMSLQYLFDRGDMKKASRVIYEFKPDGDKTLVQIMAHELGVKESAVRCETQLLSRYEGRVAVDCESDRTASDMGQKRFRFEVDVVASHLKALDATTQSLLERKVE